MSDTGSLLPRGRTGDDEPSSSDAQVGLIRSWWRSRSALVAELAEPGADDPRGGVALGGDRPTSVEALAECLSTELGRLRGEIDERDSDLVRALERVARSYDRVAEQLADNRRVQRLLAEGMTRIERRLGALERTRSRIDAPGTQHVIGGTITPPVEAAAHRDDFLDAKAFSRAATSSNPSRYSPVEKPKP